MTLRERLSAGDRVVGTVINIADPAVAELMSAEWDLVWIDREHGAVGRKEAQDILVGAAAAGTPALIRVSGCDSPEIGSSLDAGAHGVVIPNVRSADEARRALSRVAFPPTGSRGVGARRLGMLRSRGVEIEPLVMMQIETAAGVDASGAISSLDGVGALVVGTSDLSADLGVTPDAPDVARAVGVVSAAAERSGIPWGVAGGDAGVLAGLAGRAGQIMMVSTDLRIIAAAVASKVGEIRSALDAGG